MEIRYKPEVEYYTTKKKEDPQLHANVEINL